MKRRSFLDKSGLGLSTLLVAPKVWAEPKTTNSKNKPLVTPYAIATWNVPEAVNLAGTALEKGHNALDAAIEGVSFEESNLKNTTVGKGGAPDREGTVTLDACVMDHLGNCGAVMAVEQITHVASLAKEVMLKTPHVILAGEGARQFALSEGYLPENLLTPESKKAWVAWIEKSNYSPQINVENHDTIGMLCSDQLGNLSGVCTTSGLAYKMKGRVGDSPVIGSGLFVDNEVGAAVATGLGEEVIKTVGSFLIVELMRQGKTPQASCEEAINRILAKHPKKPDFQVCFIAVDTKGQIGAYSIHSGFTYTINKENKTTTQAVESVF
jgi:N4-(beta-N-acetylglucosaminyl)-L-asparaginase